MRIIRLLIPILLVVVVIVQVAIGLRWFGLGGPDPRLATRPLGEASIDIGGPFTLTAASGQTVTDRTYLGKWVLIYFGYTKCPDTCPTALNDIGNALDMLGTKSSDIAPLFITIDPTRDTPAVMAAYTAKFDKRIIGLTGTTEQIELVKQTFHVYGSPAPHDEHGKMVMDHSSVIVIMDPQGKFVDALNGNANPDVIATRLRALVH